MMNPEIKKIVDRLKQDKVLRKKVTSESHLWFFLAYFGDHIKYLTAPFQKEILHLMENEENKFLLIAAFRGSAKSTICNLSFPIWSIVGKQQKKFILTLAQTQSQAKQHLDNIKREFEKNELLKQDFGPFEEPKDEWRSASIVLSNYEAKIMAASTEESIRGVKYRNFRPQIIISDDLEDLASVKTQASRDKLFHWFTSTIIPAGDNDTRFILVGTYLDEDSLLKRFKEKIEKNDLPGIVKEYPLLDAKNQIAWPGKFSTQKHVENLRNMIANEVAWAREYLLQTISDAERIVNPEWIQTYNNLPNKNYFLRNFVSVDLAISDKETASYTAMISAKVYIIDRKTFIYILPNPINQRLNFPDTKQTAEHVIRMLGEISPTKLIIEEVGYQGAFIQDMEQKGYNAVGFKPHGSSKGQRLSLTTPAIKAREVLFPEKGTEQLINQLVNFNREKYQDLADAFSMLILYIKGETVRMPEIFFI